MKKLIKISIFYLLINLVKLKYLVFKKSYLLNNIQNITFFDRSFPNPSSDASARTFWELAYFLKDRNYKLNFFFNNLLEKTNNKIANEFNINSTTKLNFKTFFNFLRTKNLIFVKSPENFLFLEILFFFRLNHSVLFYGGDIYQNRFLSSLQYKSGTDYFFSYYEYLIYKNLEELLWKTAYVCLSPNQYEKDFIKPFNKKSLILPIRIFPSFDLTNNFSRFNINQEKCIELIFVGGSGHQPNIRALEANIKFFMKKLNKFNDINFVLNIIGRGWESSQFSHLRNLSSKIIFHGQLDDNSLNNLYKKSLFSLSLIKDGAGVKGKVIEAMYSQNIVITTDIGGQGIPKNILRTFNNDDDIFEFMLAVISGEIDTSDIIDKYYTFLKENYSLQTYEKLFNKITTYVNE